MPDRNYYRYRVKDPKGRVFHSGITKDPDAREKQHQGRWPGSHLVIEGPAVTEETAREWESRQKKSITPERK